MWKHLLSLFVSHSCYSCEQTLTIQEKLVCFSCLSQIPETGFHHTLQKNELFNRFAGKIPIDGACSLYFFDKKGILQSLIQKMKYEDVPQLGVYLGAYYGQKLLEAGWGEKLDAIVPVPLHRSKHIKRSFNQSERICYGISQVLGVPVQKNLLKRIRKTESQALKKGVDRYKNVEGAFKAVQAVPSRLLLVDDIITTGSTLEACAKAIFDNSSAQTEVIIASVGMTTSN